MTALTKEQALAVMDAHIIRVEAERRQRLERRFGRFRIIYPVLRQVPLDAIPDLIQEAGRYARRRWTLYLAATFVVAIAAWFTVLAPWLEIGPSLKGRFFSDYVFIFGTVAFVRYLHIRAYLKREVPRPSPGN